eukprot:XP_001696801.1 cohesin subunit SCC1b [Chlamydomonas reinhardtii]
MFYSTQILARKGPLGLVWMAAHMDRGLKRSQVSEASIPGTVDALLEPEVAAPMALRLSGQLLLGVCRLYSKKVAYLLQDTQDALPEEVEREEGAEADAAPGIPPSHLREWLQVRRWVAPSLATPALFRVAAGGRLLGVSGVGDATCCCALWRVWASHAWMIDIRTVFVVSRCDKRVCGLPSQAAAAECFYDMLVLNNRGLVRLQQQQQPGNPFHQRPRTCVTSRPVYKAYLRTPSVAGLGWAPGPPSTPPALPYPDDPPPTHTSTERALRDGFQHIARGLMFVQHSSNLRPTRATGHPGPPMHL